MVTPPEGVTMKTGDRNRIGSRDALGSLAALLNARGKLWFLISFQINSLTYTRVGKSHILITLPAQVWNWVSKLVCMCILTYIHDMILGF